MVKRRRRYIGVLQARAVCLPLEGLGPGFTAGAVWGVIASQLFAMSAVLEAARFGRGVAWVGLFLVPGAMGLAAAQGLVGACGLLSALRRPVSAGLGGKLLRFYVAEAARLWMMSNFKRGGRD